MSQEQNPNINTPDEEIGESIAAKRLAMRGAPSAPPPPDFEPEDGRSPFRRKLDNFWYHYKFHTIAGLCLLVILAITIPQCVFRTTYDSYILYAGPMMDCGGGEMVAGVQNGLLDLGMPDYNGDGKREVMYRPIFLLSQQQLDEMKETDKNITLNAFLVENQNLLTNEIMAGECYICLFDPSLFEKYLGESDEDSWIVNMNDILDPADIPENDYNDYGVRLSSLDFGKYFAGFKNMPEDTILCFRRVSITNETETGKANAIDLFRRIVTFSLS